MIYCSTSPNDDTTFYSSLLFESRWEHALLEVSPNSCAIRFAHGLSFFSFPFFLNLAAVLQMRVKVFNARHIQTLNRFNGLVFFLIKKGQARNIWKPLLKHGTCCSERNSSLHAKLFGDPQFVTQATSVSPGARLHLLLKQ